MNFLGVLVFFDARRIQGQGARSGRRRGPRHLQGDRLDRGLGRSGRHCGRGEPHRRNVGGVDGPVQVASAPIDVLYEDQIAGTGAPEPAIEGIDFPALLARLADIVSTTADPIAARKKVGAVALEHDRVPESMRHPIIEARLPSHDWPETPISIPAIRADTGELAVFDRPSGVSVVDAVAASCAIAVVWPAVTVDGRRYYDDGVRSVSNTDLAKGFARVLVVEPMPMPETSDVEDISSKSPVLTISLDEASAAEMGANPLDPELRGAVGASEFAQGIRIADQVGAFWS